MRVLVFFCLIVIFVSCVKNKNGVTVQNAVSPVKNVFEVKEVVQGSNYTYLKVNENRTEKWIAVSKQDVKTGDVYYYEGAMQMNNFTSKELGRTFDVIYFVSQISKTPIGVKSAGGGMPAHSGTAESQKLGSAKLNKNPGEITVAEVFEKRVEFAAKEIEIRGIVVKINKQVMGKNWIHIQDGTESDGNFDLTVTTQDLPVKGDEVTFKGKVSVNKDFGSGYRYPVILEDAAVLNKKPDKKPI